jgi:hypothetical protein
MRMSNRGAKPEGQKGATVNDGRQGATWQLGPTGRGTSKESNARKPGGQGGRKDNGAPLAGRTNGRTTGTASRKTHGTTTGGHSTRGRGSRTPRRNRINLVEGTPLLDVEVSSVALKSQLESRRLDPMGLHSLDLEPSRGARLPKTSNRAATEPSTLFLGVVGATSRDGEDTKPKGGVSGARRQGGGVGGGVLIPSSPCSGRARLEPIKHTCARGKV